MVEVSEIKMDKTISGLKGMKNATPAMVKSMVRVVCSKSKKYVRKGFKSMLKSRSGETLKSIKHKVYKDGHGVVYMAARPKAYMNIVGGTIFPKSGKYLYFTGTDGQLRRVKSVTIPSRDFFEPSMETYLKSGEPVRDMQSKLDKDIEKQWKK